MCYVIYRCMVKIRDLLMEDETPASSESRLFMIERSERVKGMLRAKMRRGFILNVSMGACERNQAKADFS